MADPDILANEVSRVRAPNPSRRTILRRSESVSYEAGFVGIGKKVARSLSHQSTGKIAFRE
ncbi:MAG: hypothetical protein JW800_06105 [Candidatus Omnitrophica bacterium]|nr:hypothetical protein [Candidatus Omnitrophota bacterium]